MSKRTQAVIAGVGLFLAGYLSLQAQAVAPQAPTPATPAVQAPAQSASAAPATGHRAVVDKYCVVCHNEKRLTAGLALDKANIEQVTASGEIWEKVIRKLRAGAMPPAGMPRPDRTTYDGLASYLETSLDRAAAAAPNPGRTGLHRLNRVEYTNAIRDLLGLEIDGATLLPTDESAYGFDNIADTLTLSPVLLERYMLAATKISRLAIGDMATRPRLEIYRIPEQTEQHDRRSDDLPFASRGGTAIRHYFPLDGEYTFRIYLQGSHNNDAIRGLARREQIEIRLDGARVQLFSIGGECAGPPPLGPECQGDALVEYQREADEKLQVRVPVKAGDRLVGVSFLRRTSAALEGAIPTFVPVTSTAYANNIAAEMAVEYVHINGPFNPTGPGDTPSRRKIFVCRPTSGRDEEACATKILSRLAKLAYRRPQTEQDVQTLVSFYRMGRRKGDFEAGIQFALERLLVSPEFLVRVEGDSPNAAPGAVYRLTDLELASRLSFLLWSSIPDEELIDVAGRGGLKDPAVLEKQVRRMLADPRSKALVDNFAGQWLYLRNIQVIEPDLATFPEFDGTLREGFKRETELFIENQLREDRSVVDLLTADYTFLNERLAKFYGIPNVYGNHFRKVAYPDDRRAGLLGHGSILTITSYSTRTSPVVRGKWLLENFLAAPPPPPPPNVPPLAENNAAKPTSVRERLEQHRRNPVCASCHARMDPLGFALENFDAIGGWRTSDKGVAIDASGVLPDGTKFNGPGEFRKALLNHKGEFVGAVTERLLTYALGRGLEYYDMPAVRKVIQEAAASNYRWSSIILGIAKSTPFQMRAAPARRTPNNTSSQIARRVE